MNFAVFRIRNLVVSARSCWLAVVALGPQAMGQGNFSPGVWEVDPITKQHTAQVLSPYNGVPNRGYLPVRAIITNRSDFDRRWTFNFSASGSDSQTRFSSNFSVTAPAKTADVVHEFMVPLPPLFTYTYENSVNATISSGSRTFRGSVESAVQYQWTSMGFSNGLDNRRNLQLLTNEVQSRTSTGFGGGYDAGILFDPTELTSDWRGYTGFDVLMMTDKEWQTLEPPVQTALKAWMRLGGHLHLFSTTPGAKASTFGITTANVGPIGSATRNQEDRSLGQVFIHQWDGKDLPLARLVSMLSSSPKLADNLEKDFADRWQLQAEFGTKPFNPTLMFIILIAFAVMVGPINLFILAKPGMRHRLFFTTPIISVAASLLLVMLIVFKDGFGGSGLRIALMMLQSNPDERRAYIVQEQLGRTGVLLGRSFELDDPTFISPAVMRSSRWTHFDTAGDYVGSYRYANQSLAGDWFQSRSEQAHFSQTIRPTRAAILLESIGADGTPKMVSRVDFKLDEFYYIDNDGQVWKSSGAVNAGDEIQLTRAGGGTGDEKGKQVAETFWRDASTRFTKRMRTRVQDFPNRRNVFLAVSSSARDQLIPTLGAMRWNDDVLLLVGEPVTRAQAQPQPTDGNN
ncbi:MAG: hypothetical protein AAF585_01750 [Verrucomicrobiota bacterium]